MPILTSRPRIVKALLRIVDSFPLAHYIKGMYKPRGQIEGEGVVQMTTIILNKSYLVKVYT